MMRLGSRPRLLICSKEHPPGYGREEVILIYIYIYIYIYVCVCIINNTSVMSAILYGIQVGHIFTRYIGIR